MANFQIKIRPFFGKARPLYTLSDSDELTEITKPKPVIEKEITQKISNFWEREAKIIRHGGRRVAILRFTKGNTIYAVLITRAEFDKYNALRKEHTLTKIKDGKMRQEVVSPYELRIHRKNLKRAGLLDKKEKKSKPKPQKKGPPKRTRRG